MSGKKGFFATLFSGKPSGGCCDMQITEEQEPGPIVVLGTGCSNCVKLQANTEAAVKELGLDIPVQHISDFQRIMEYNVMSVPALVLNQKVVSVGKVLKTEEITKLLSEAFS